MKNALASITLLLSACAYAPVSETDPQTLRDEVRGRFDSLVSAIRSLDSNRYFEHFDQARFTALNHDGTVTPAFDVFQHDFVKAFAGLKRYQSLEFQNLKISLIDANTAILINEYSATIELNSGAVTDVAGAGSQVWHKSADSWLLVSISSSARPAPAQ